MREHRFLQIVLGIVLSTAILAAAVALTLNFRPLYVRDVGAYDLPGRTGMSQAEILEQYDALIAYNNIGGPDVLEFPDLPSSETGLIHFAEVKTIFLAFEWWAILGGILSIAGILFFRRQKSKRYLQCAGLISLLFPAAVGLLVALCWDKVFVWFHQIFFRNDYWIFSADTDPIILLLPDGYFMHCAVLIIGLYLLGGAACLICYGLSRRKRN